MAHALENVFRGTVRLACLLAFVAATVACTPSLSGGPERVFRESAQLDFVRKHFPLPKMNAYLAQGEGPRRTFRNEYVLAQIYAMDVNYGVYEAALTREMQAIGFGSTVANIALTSVASQISPVGTKDILTATAAGLSGVRASYEKDILIDRTIQIIQSQMRASRARVATRILNRLRLSADDYPLMMAWIDLQDYYKAGTFTDGLVEVRQTVGEQAIAAAAERDYVVINGLTGSGPEFDSIVAFLYPNGPDAEIDVKRRSYLYSTLSRKDESIQNIIRLPKYTTVRAKLLECSNRYLAADPCPPNSVPMP